MIRPFDLLRRLRAAVTSVLLLSATGSYAPTHGDHRVQWLRPTAWYRVVGICYWLYCTWTGCTVRTSVRQVPHPDAVVSSPRTPAKPWVEVRGMSTPNPSAQAGGDGTTTKITKTISPKFKNADVIGHPGGEVFNQFVRPSGYFCQGAGTAFMPYCSVPWTRWPGATTYRDDGGTRGIDPGMREVGARARP